MPTFQRTMLKMKADAVKEETKNSFWIWKSGRLNTSGSFYATAAPYNVDNLETCTGQ
jgi:hypothetical protein